MKIKEDQAKDYLQTLVDGGMTINEAIAQFLLISPNFYILHKEGKIMSVDFVQESISDKTKTGGDFLI